MGATTTTELGVLPSDWRVDRFDSVFDVQQGRQVSKGNRIGDNQRPFLRTKNVFWNRLDLTDLDEMHFSKADETRLALKPDDLLICEGGDIGRTGIWRGAISNCYYQNHLHRARIRTPKTADAQFVLFWLWYAFEFGHLYFGRGNVTTIPNLSQSKLRELPVAIPPLAEQRKIAGVLGLVQRTIEQQGRLIALTTELKKVLLHQLFTQGLRGEPQKQTEIGLVPQSWETHKIGEHCSSSAFGPRFSSDLYASDGNVVTLRTTDLDDDGNIDYREAPKAQIDIGKFESHLLKPGDVVVSRSGTCGIAAVFEGLDMPVLPGAFLIRVRLTSSLRPQFLRYYINSPVGHPRIMNLAQGAIQKNISGTALKAFEVPVPSTEDQADVEAHVEALDRKLRLHARKKQSLTALFRTLLHQLMTAQIRTHDLDLNGIIQPQETL
jgi:type I restriction enzyme, S subunit